MTQNWRDTDSDGTIIITCDLLFIVYKCGLLLIAPKEISSHVMQVQKIINDEMFWCSQRNVSIVIC